jgi:endonuclease YncB( thermonuclease family)
VVFFDSLDLVVLMDGLLSSYPNKLQRHRSRIQVSQNKAKETRRNIWLFKASETGLDGKRSLAQGYRGKLR